MKKVKKNDVGFPKIGQILKHFLDYFIKHKRLISEEWVTDMNENYFFFITIDWKNEPVVLTFFFFEYDKNQFKW